LDSLEAPLAFFEKTIDFINKRHELLRVPFRSGKVAEFHPSFFLWRTHKIGEGLGEGRQLSIAE
jgi:hypothetical protein